MGQGVQVEGGAGGDHGDGVRASDGGRAADGVRASDGGRTAVDGMQERTVQTVGAGTPGLLQLPRRCILIHAMEMSSDGSFYILMGRLATNPISRVRLTSLQMRKVMSMV